ncbi:MAG: ABC transporter substrate-binding protein [Planctomycetota bacterium]
MRIVSADASITEILFGLNAGSLVVGRSSLCDHPAEALQLPVFCDMQRLDEAALRKLNPDLLVAHSSLQCPIVDRAAQMGFQTLCLHHMNLEMIFNNINLLGRLTDRVQPATRMLTEMQNSFTETMRDSARIATQLNTRQLPPPRVLIEEWGDPPITAGRWCSQLIAYAGAQDAFPEVSNLNSPRQRTLTPEAILQRNPDIVVLAWRGFRGEVDTNKVWSRPGFIQMPAVQRQLIFAVDDRIFMRPGPNLMEGARELVKLVRMYAQAT